MLMDALNSLVDSIYVLKNELSEQVYFIMTVCSSVCPPQSLLMFIITDAVRLLRTAILHKLLLLYGVIII